MRTLSQIMPKKNLYIYLKELNLIKYQIKLRKIIIKNAKSFIKIKNYKTLKASTKMH